MKNIFTLVVIIILTGCSSDKAEILSYGITENEIIKTEVNSDLVAGEKHIINSWNLIKRTENIPNEFGIEFGISYLIKAPFYKDSVTVEEIVVFPGEGVTNPENGRSTKIDSETLIIDNRDEQYFTYALDYPWEMKSGTWLFQVKQDGLVLLEQAFNVQP